MKKRIFLLLCLLLTVFTVCLTSCNEEIVESYWIYNTYSYTINYNYTGE